MSAKAGGTPLLCKLYLIHYDAELYYVEAPSFDAAIERWKEYVAVEWGDECEGDEMPESLQLLSDVPVIR